MQLEKLFTDAVVDKIHYHKQTQQRKVLFFTIHNFIAASSLDIFSLKH